LISHQNVLSNVELALTLSGVSAAERRERAIAALEQVGLGDQIYKKPAEMSGGQVQRVAIARALINDPDIILADEPTGALDTETSTQVMDILKEISADRLVIMVTHNPELAEAYSTRIVRLSDGRVISDSNPFVPGAANAALAGAVPAAAGAASLADAADAAGLADTAAPGRRKASGRASGRRNRSMSMATALHLSLNNLMTKKARTLLTAFAGSIGIIGIALILSVSHGFQTYIDKLEEDTLSSYPLTIQAETADMTSMIAAFMANAQDTEGEASGDKVHEQRIMTDMLASVGTNDLAAFKERVDTNIDTIGDWFNAYDYSYGLTVNIYSTNMEYGPLRVSPGSIMQSYMSGFQQSNFSMMNSDVFFQMMDNEELLKSQYKVLAGKWPEKYNELLLVLDSEDQLNDYIVYTLGLRDPQELKDMINDVMNGEEVENTSKQLEWTYDDFLGMEFALVHSCDTYKRNSSYDVWEDMTEDDAYMEDLINRSEKLKITGIVCAKEVSAANAMDSGIGYLPLLTRHMIEYASESDIVKIQRENKNTDVFSGKTFESIRNKTDEGLGFEDMISIDENKLRKALGGDIDPNAVTNAIKDNIQDALEDADPSGMIKDIMTAVGTNAGAIMKDLLTQEPDKLYTIPLDDEAIDKALGDHLDTGKHRSVVNKLLKEYVAELKKQAATMREEWSGQAQALQTQIESHPEMIPFIIAQYEQQGITITEEELRESLANADGRVMLPTAAEKLPSLLEEFLKSDSTVNAVAAYAEGIALAETAKNVPPAVINTAKTVGGLIKVDAAGIADAFTMKMDEDEITRLITAYVSGGQETNYDRNLRKLGYADLTKPEAMSFYLKDFESKEAFLKFIDEYNKEMQDNGDEDKVISYTDVTGVMIKSVKNITNAVSYVLIAFVAISLIVSS
ncbi:MAG: ATP-binding cassette domain-containing protein, partial [Mogibacterium sp.]|nr:ATP-binding cassette domain-containing protein [Mogibacterium sp.]